MATYEFRCPGDGDFELRLPLGQAPPEAPCPACASRAVRIFSPPALAGTPRRLAAALDRAARSAEAPEVVSRIPERRVRRRPRHPGHARLPRP